MMIKTITAAPVERDANGFWTHPDFFEPANGNEFGVEGEFDAWKALNRVTGKLEWMECEENAEELQPAYDAADCNLNMWQPVPPAGEGWFLASIHDTEDGPFCYWLRPIECDPDALAAHIDNCYAEAFQNEHLIAERDALLAKLEATQARLLVPIKLPPHVFVEDEFCKVHNYTLWRCAEAIRAAGYPVKWDRLATTTPEPLVPGDFMLAPKNPSIAMLTVLGLTGSFESMTEKYQKMLALAQATSSDTD